MRKFFYFTIAAVLISACSALPTAEINVATIGTNAVVNKSIAAAANQFTVQSYFSDFNFETDIENFEL